MTAEHRAMLALALLTVYEYWPIASAKKRQNGLAYPEIEVIVMVRMLLRTGFKAKSLLYEFSRVT
jgi:hypothetical protein